MRAILFWVGCATLPVTTRPPVLFGDRPAHATVVDSLDVPLERDTWLPALVDRLRDEGQRRACDVVRVSSGWVMDGALVSAESRDHSLRPQRGLGIHAECLKL
jgi:hypothetical protein